MKKKTPLLGVKLTGGLEDEMTSWAGVSLAIELWRNCGAMEITERVLPQKKSSKGLIPGQMVESFILLSALGGDCVDDMEKLRQDKCLAAMLGYTPSAPETARQWLDKFHVEITLPAGERVSFAGKLSCDTAPVLPRLASLIMPIAKGKR